MQDLKDNTTDKAESKDKAKPKPKPKPKVSVVLGSGGLKPLAAVALLDFLQEANIDINLLIGCSGGSLVSVGSALGYNSSEIIDFYKEYFRQKPFSAYDYKTLLGIANLPLGNFGIDKGVIKSEKLLSFYKDVYGDSTFNDLKTRTLLQSTDIQSGRGVVLEEGELVKAIYASTALYPLAPPIHFQDKWLVDGVFSSPLPILEAVNQGADIIIAAVFHENNDANPKHFFGGFFNTISCFSRSLTQSQIALAIDLHHYEIIPIHFKFDSVIGMHDASQLEEIVESGRKTVEFKKEEILDAIKNWDLHQNN